jgi:hypothetical protein
MHDGLSVRRESGIGRAAFLVREDKREVEVTTSSGSNNASGGGTALRDEQRRGDA